jgi:N-methylhydantoinase A/oxoprolinase/acetone carboxylase beta subunit
MPAGNLREAFFQSYADHYGYRPEEPAIEVESVRVVASSMTSSNGLVQSYAGGEVSMGDLPSRQEAFMEGSWKSVRAYNRVDLAPGFEFPGPSLVFENHCSTVVHWGWLGRVDAQGCLVLVREDSGKDGK